MSFQKCPICNGNGRVESPPGISSCVYEICSVCKGAKIISEINGLPPIYNESKQEQISAPFST